MAALLAIIQRGISPRTKIRIAGFIIAILVAIVVTIVKQRRKRD